MTRTMALVNGHPYYVGCVIDGHTGWRGIAEVCEIALNLGWKPKGQREPRRLRYLLKRYVTNEATERMTDALIGQGGYADEAEAWLNDNTEEGFVWHWSDGEFFLSPYCGGDEDCNDETCACHVFN